MHFNPRLREGGDLKRIMSNTSLYNFNPRLREGGDEVDHRLPYFFSISIHASAREATVKEGQILLIIDISIHASAREATIPMDA